MNSYIIIGGAGFIGSHFVDKLIVDSNTSKITVYDNFCSGRWWHLEQHKSNSKLNIIHNDVKNIFNLNNAVLGHDIVLHLSSNADISKATTKPDIDFWEGTYLTSNILEAMRQTGVKRLLYASGSGVYGDIGDIEAKEDRSLLPSSTYGASKLAGEALIRSYCSMFGMSACAFRFGNVVGARQTHGVGFDFIKRLLKDPSSLRILGDGNQSKSYIHVSDIVKAVLLANEKLKTSFEVYNVATGDYITVTEIAKLAMECLEIPEHSVIFDYTGGDRGWKGDVPIVRLNTDKIKSLGWKCSMPTKEALKQSILSMLPDIKANKM